MDKQNYKITLNKIRMDPKNKTLKYLIIPIFNPVIISCEIKNNVR